MTLSALMDKKCALNSIILEFVQYVDEFIKLRTLIQQ